MCWYKGYPSCTWNLDGFVVCGFCLANKASMFLLLADKIFIVVFSQICWFRRYFCFWFFFFFKFYLMSIYNFSIMTNPPDLYFWTIIYYFHHPNFCPILSIFLIFLSLVFLFLFCLAVCALLLRVQPFSISALLTISYIIRLCIF